MHIDKWLFPSGHSWNCSGSGRSRSPKLLLWKRHSQGTSTRTYLPPMLDRPPAASSWILMYLQTSLFSQHLCVHSWPNAPCQNTRLIIEFPVNCILRDTNIRKMKISNSYICRDRISDIVNMICEAFVPSNQIASAPLWGRPPQSAFGGASSRIPGNSTLIQWRKIADINARGWQMMATAALIGL